MPCKLNHYCVDGLRYQCPANTPVTQGTGAGALSECLTCTQRNGNSANPIYDDLVGDCVSCYEYDSSTPIWDGNACVACASGTAWNANENACIATIPQATECTADEDCVYKIPHGDGTLYLVENVDYTAFEDIAPKSAEEETEEFLAKYGIQNVLNEDYTGFPDRWAGAMKYCQDKGLRLPTMDELVSIMNVVYGTSKTCEDYCNGISSDKTGCCDFDSLSVANTELWNFLKSGATSTTSVAGHFNLWSSAGDFYGAYGRSFNTSSSSYSGSSYEYDYPRALCVR